MEVRLDLPAAPDVELVAVRAAEVLGRRAGFSRESLEAIGVAVAEACLNAIEHGSDGGVAVRVFAEVEPGERPALVIEVEDHGRGFDPAAVRRRRAKAGRPRKRGWGLEIMRELMDDVTIDSHPGRTLVRMRKRLEARG